MAWTFYDANGNSLQLTGAHTLGSHTGTLAIASGGTASVNAAAALEALGVGVTDSPTFVDLTLTDDLLLTSSGAVINFNSGDMTITHGSNTLTIAGGTFATAALTTSTIVASDVITGTTVEATADTSVGDNAAMGYTSAEGLILTGQGSTNDITIKNDADATVMSIPTGTTGVTFTGNVDILAQGDLRLQDTSGNQYVALQAAGTTTTHTLTFPAAVATTAGDVLSSSTGGVLSWTTPSAGVGIGMVIALGG